MTTARSILLFILAALAEIGGAWLIWQGVRGHRGWLWIGAGVVALGLYGRRRGIAGVGDGARWLPARPLGRHRGRGVPRRGRRHHVRATTGLRPAIPGGVSLNQEDP